MTIDELRRLAAGRGFYQITLAPRGTSAPQVIRGRFLAISESAVIVVPSGRSTRSASTQIAHADILAIEPVDDLRD